MARILNNILCTIMIFLLTFAWTVYCLRSVEIALILSSIVAACSCYIIFAVLTKWEKKKTVTKKQKAQLQNFQVYLQFCSDSSALFEPVFKYYGYNVARVDFDNAILSKDDKIFTAMCFQGANLTEAQIQSAVVNAKRQDCKQLFLFGCKADNALLTIANTQLPTKFIDLSNTFALFEQAEMVPDLPTVKAKKSGIIPKIALNKNRFGWYLGGALFTLFTSFFSFVKVYLLIWSTVLLALAMYSLFNKKYNKIPTAVKLE